MKRTGERLKEIRTKSNLLECFQLLQLCCREFSSLQIDKLIVISASVHANAMLFSNNLFFHLTHYIFHILQQKKAAHEMLSTTGMYLGWTTL